MISLESLLAAVMQLVKICEAKQAIYELLITNCDADYDNDNDRVQLCRDAMLHYSVARLACALEWCRSRSCDFTRAPQSVRHIRELGTTWQVVSD